MGELEALVEVLAPSADADLRRRNGGSVGPPA